MQPEHRLLPTFQPADTIATPARVMIDDPLVDDRAQDGPQSLTTRT